MTSFLYCVLLFQVNGLTSLFPSTATDSDLTDDESDKTSLSGLFGEQPSVSGSSESSGIFGPTTGPKPATEDETQSSFGLKCPEPNMFRPSIDPDNNYCPAIKQYDDVWIWETPHPYSHLTCCLDTFQCPNLSEQVHLQLQSFFGIKTSLNPNQCEVKGVHFKALYDS